MEERTTVQFMILTTKTKSLWDLICWVFGLFGNMFVYPNLVLVFYACAHVSPQHYIMGGAEVPGARAHIYAHLLGGRRRRSIWPEQSGSNGRLMTETVRMVYSVWCVESEPAAVLTL